MIPGTTPTFIITLKNAEGRLAETKNLRVYIRQQDVLIQKEKKDLIIDTETNSIGITLTQKESLKLLYKKGNIEFQVHGLLDDGVSTWKTYVVNVPVHKTLSMEVLEDETETSNA